jgi:hypothetical protein
MVPISGRLPDDLYQWLSTFFIEGATTISDKMRVAVANLKRVHDGDSDYVGALAMYRDLGRTTRERIATLERDHGEHSEVLATLLEHVPALMAALNAAQPSTVEEARQLEDVLVRRTMQLCETLLRQAVTTQAAAYDPQVVSKNADRLLELARLIPPHR